MPADDIPMLPHTCMYSLDCVARGTVPIQISDDGWIVVCEEHKAAIDADVEAKMDRLKVLLRQLRGG